jgi:peptidoglycan/xylan/chitin deacetylase (PgdA/CDA1 family)
MSGSGATVPILMYHSFAARSSSSFRHLTVAPSLFDEQLAALCQAGFGFVRVRDVPSLLRTRPVQDRVVAVSIDDGLADGLDAAATLAARGLTATYFVPTGFVGGTARWLEGDDAKLAMLDWTDLAGLAATGMELGSHGHNHVAADLNPRAVVRADAERSRHALEGAIGTAVSSYAYPFGYQGRSARRAVADAGFARACAIFGLPACRGDEVLALPRLHVGPEMSGEDVVALCSRRWGAVARFEAHQRQRVWTAARRIVPLGPRSSRRVGADNPGSSVGDGAQPVDRIA